MPHPSPDSYESAARLISRVGILLANEDHGHLPIVAKTRVLEAVDALPTIAHDLQVAADVLRAQAEQDRREKRDAERAAEHRETSHMIGGWPV